jgi:hypothetical protein
MVTPLWGPKHTASAPLLALIYPGFVGILSENPHRRADLLAIDGSGRYPIGLFSPDRLAARE